MLNVYLTAELHAVRRCTGAGAGAVQDGRVAAAAGFYAARFVKGLRLCRAGRGGAGGLGGRGVFEIVSNASLEVQE